MTTLDRSRTAGNRLRISGGIAGIAVLAGSLLLWGRSGSSGTGDIDMVARFLLAIAVIVGAANLLALLLSRLSQPPVIGEMIAGLLLGPSVFGALAPAARDWVFPPAVLSVLGLAAQLGLVVFLFLLGCELRMHAAPGRTLGLLTAGSIGLPFLVGAAVAIPFAPRLSGSAGNTPVYVLFIGLAVAITALPVLARILTDLKLIHTRVGGLSIAGAAIGDGIAWGALTAVLAVTGIGGTGTAFYSVTVISGLIAATALLTRPALMALVRWTERDTGDSGSRLQLLTAVLTAGALAYAALTQLIGLHPAIGAFLFGLAVPRGSALIERVQTHLQGFAVIILMPIFFASVMLNTAIGQLGEHLVHWLIFGALLAVAIFSKLIGSGAGALLAGLPRREALQIGVLMNCRGVTEIVVAAIGLQYGLVNELGFTILVFIALITTAATGPLIKRLTAQP